jgi:hypothetical protein
VSGFVAPDPIKHVPTAAKFVIRALKAASGIAAFSSELDTGSREENASIRDFDRLEV